MAQTTKSSFQSKGWTVSQSNIQKTKPGQWTASVVMSNKQGQQSVYLIATEDRVAYHETYAKAQEAIRKWKTT